MQARFKRWPKRVIMMLGWVGLLFLPRKAPATIAEQRARLPPAAECGEDPATGIWRSHKYDSRFGDWARFELEVHRVPGQPNQLKGTIRNHGWSGDKHQSEPPTCTPGSFEWLVSTDAKGSIQGDQIQFYGVGQWRIDRVFCSRGPYGYNLDHFSGVIDAHRQEFQSLNNDGGRDINVPYVFRRIRCFSEGAVHLSAPMTKKAPFYPEKKTKGCSLF
jgi:hypothetical protein